MLSKLKEMQQAQVEIQYHLMNIITKSNAYARVQRMQSTWKAEEKMKTILGTKVIINQKDSMKGKIEIEYYSPDELTRIYELIESIKK